MRWGGGFASVNAEGENSSHENLLFNTVQAVQKAADQIDFNAPPPNPSMAATISETVYGLCGGYARYTITVDDGNGDFFGSMNFVGFCEGTILLSGKARFSGSLDSDQEAEFFEFSFDMMSVSANGVAVTMDGTFSMDLTTIPVSITMDLYIQDSLGHVCWIDNYHWAITEDIGFVSVEISGRFYHPHHGFVDLFTESPLIIDDGQIYPKDGILVLQGANNTEAKLIALNQTQCEVTADFDDDGIHEYSSGVLLWEDL